MTTVSKFTGTYTTMIELTDAQLKAPMRSFATTRDQAIVKAARLSMDNDNQVYYVEVTYTKVFMSTGAPAFDTGHYRIIGNKVEKYTPKCS
jgi:hypothetical protein